MGTLKINADRPALEIVRGGQVTRWEYDLITLKIEAERLEGLHALKDGNRMKPPTVGFLADFAAYLVVNGLEGCSLDTAHKVYSLVCVQFRQMAKALSEQVAEMSK